MTLNSPWPIRSRGFGFVEYSSMEQVDACQVSQPIRLQYFLGSGSILLHRLTVSPYLQNISIVVSGNLTWEGERRSNKLLFSFKIVTGNCFLSGFHFFSISPTGKVGSSPPHSDENVFFMQWLILCWKNRYFSNLSSLLIFNQLTTFHLWVENNKKLVKFEVWFLFLYKYRYCL